MSKTLSGLSQRIADLAALDRLAQHESMFDQWLQLAGQYLARDIGDFGQKLAKGMRLLAQLPQQAQLPLVAHQIQAVPYRALTAGGGAFWKSFKRTDWLCVESV